MSKMNIESSKHQTWRQSYSDRASLPQTQPLAAHLFRLMSLKRTNLCISADVQSTAQLLDLAEDCGDSICVLKTHADIIYDFGDRTIRGLTEIAARKRFLIFEDRKFGDIGNTVQTQYAAGPYRIASWSSITNAHIFPGPAIITALKSAAFSALAAYNSSISTEISGGSTSNSSGEEESDEDTDDDDEDDDSSSETTQQSRNPSNLAPMDNELRRSSVVSISTTISSKAEYISPSLSPQPSSPNVATTGVNRVEEQPPLSRGLLLLAQMSSANNLFTQEYTLACVQMAREHQDFVLGFIAQQGLNTSEGDNFLTMTPGVSLPPASAKEEIVPSAGPTQKLPIRERNVFPSSTSQSTLVRPSTSESTGDDGLGQQYNTPHHVIVEKGVDIIIVGRGILNAKDRRAEAERYRREGWQAYLERIGGAHKDQSSSKTPTNQERQKSKGGQSSSSAGRRR